MRDREAEMKRVALLRAGRAGREMAVCDVGDILDRLREYAKNWRTRAISVKQVRDAIAEIERLRLVVAAPQPAPDAMREVAARIIDPEAFQMMATIGNRTDVVGAELWRARRAEALLKADAIAALYFEPAPVGGPPVTAMYDYTAFGPVRRHVDFR